ncbi:hypothetical protein LJ737_25325 [Hymenobacter sp. 15J16-1T3B]|nr:hypothetical protein [Hymenobacter sp. 15J16-1T3B]
MICGLGWLLTTGVVACGTPDSGSQTTAKQPISYRADTGGSAVAEAAASIGLPDTGKPRTDGKIIDYFPPQCYSVQFPDSALLRPVALRRSFTGKVFVAVKADTASRRLTHFQLWGVRIHPRAQPDSAVALRLLVGKPVPDSLARLLPQLEQHIRKLRPQIVVGPGKTCEMPAEWIIPVLIR